jgi:hypothetical protein
VDEYLEAVDHIRAPLSGGGGEWGLGGPVDQVHHDLCRTERIGTQMQALEIRPTPIRAST